MKKTYIAPKERIISIDLDAMIAQSLTSDLDGTEYGGDTDGLISGGDVKRQYKSLWEEEW